jgi:hypothetical protein
MGDQEGCPDAMHQLRSSARSQLFRNDAYDGARSSSIHMTYSGGGTSRITEGRQRKEGGFGRIKDIVTIHVFLRQKEFARAEGRMSHAISRESI